MKLKQWAGLEVLKNNFTGLWCRRLQKARNIQVGYYRTARHLRAFFLNQKKTFFVSTVSKTFQFCLDFTADVVLSGICSGHQFHAFLHLLSGSSEYIFYTHPEHVSTLELGKKVVSCALGFYICLNQSRMGRINLAVLQLFKIGFVVVVFPVYKTRRVWFLQIPDLLIQNESTVIIFMINFKHISIQDGKSRPVKEFFLIAISSSQCSCQLLWRASVKHVRLVQRAALTRHNLETIRRARTVISKCA